MPEGMMDLRNFHSETGVFTPIQNPEEVEVSVVIPVFNEHESIPELYDRLSASLLSSGKIYEIIFIDDGSTDGTFEVLNGIQFQDSRVWVIQLRRNFGQSAAFSAGFDLAHGEAIVTMDGDLQNDPADIPNLLEKLDEGFDVVSGWRVDRKDLFLTRRLPSMAANAIISKVTGLDLHDYGCSLKAYRQEVVKNIKLYGELHRFIPAIASWMGIKVAEIPVNHSFRKHGRSHYGLGRTLKVFLDLITVKFLLNYATRPLQIFGLAGMISFVAGMGLSIYLSILRLFFDQPLSNRPILLLAVLLIMLGVQLIVMGLLGELIVRTYHESQGKSIYVVRDILHSPESKDQEN
ncbi:MAG: glycosyltransferase family 2 protein [Anaerolineales bacterium]